jgi:hypothetical protein
MLFRLERRAVEQYAAERFFHGEKKNIPQDRFRVNAARAGMGKVPRKRNKKITGA